MKKEITVREWQQAYQDGKFDSDDINTQIDAGWYDWFCENEELSERLDNLAAIIMKITNPEILDHYYVWFKNNCPADGSPLYDDIRFEPLNEEERDIRYFMISCNDKRNNYEYELVTMPDIDAGKITFASDSLHAIVRYINNM